MSESSLMALARRISGVRCLVTGAAGFIGSNLSERLIEFGATVIGLDAFTDYYDPAIKRANIAGAVLARSSSFRLIEADLVECDIAPILDGVDVIFHLAAQAGVRSSWGADFPLYLNRNLYATQRILEAMAAMTASGGRDGAGRSPKRIVFASSSSVYGDAESFPTKEDAVRAPVSPYGITKSACEDMLRIYGGAHGIAWTALRYFTAYGPRQRPDMAFQKLMTMALFGGEFTVHGDGSQQRDFTFVRDAVDATIAAAVAEQSPFQVINIGGGSMISLREVLDHVSSFACRDFKIVYSAPQLGDARTTGASIEKARRILSYEPSISWRDGLDLQRKQIEAAGV